MDADHHAGDPGPLLLAALVSLAVGWSASRPRALLTGARLPRVPGLLVGAQSPPVIRGRGRARTPVGTGRALGAGRGPFVRCSDARWRVAGAALLFVAGFTVVSAIMVGAVAVRRWSTTRHCCNVAGGVVMIVMGLAFAGLILVP
ncbi:hypothetical protein HBB16_06280 [Pseudonocardia sp. MCCB 268]|nr:hypothetical protein [Pseudonocardia cytotoxica]